MVQFHRKSINLHVGEIQNPDIRYSCSILEPELDLQVLRYSDNEHVHS